MKREKEAVVILPASLCIIVASLAEAWIEINNVETLIKMDDSRFPCGSVD